MAASRQTQKKVDRPERTPIHRARNTLTTINIPGKHLRWVSDRPGRCKMFLEAGYEFVTDEGMTVGDKKVDGDTSVGGTVCKQGDSDGTQMYLMAIDLDLYKADQKAKQLEIDETEKSMYEEVNEDGRYGEGLQTQVSRKRSTI